VTVDEPAADAVVEPRGHAEFDYLLQHGVRNDGPEPGEGP
jgi:hypothetical protein